MRRETEPMNRSTKMRLERDEIRSGRKQRAKLRQTTRKGQRILKGTVS